jgi:heat shock protein HslJ
VRALFVAVSLAVLLAACSSAPAAADATLDGTSWQLVSIQSADAPETAADPGKYTVTFGGRVDGVGRATFLIDCNRGNGTWQATESGGLTFGPIATTLMACPPPTIDQQVSLALAEVSGYTIAADQLRMSLRTEGKALIWAPLPG